MGKIAIHGFGRIGRSLLKAALRDKLFVPFSISDIFDFTAQKKGDREARTYAALFAADSNYGLWPGEAVAARENVFRFDGSEVNYYKTKDSLPPWGELGVDVVVDCTGRATQRDFAQPHLDRGAKRVLVSAPSKDRKDCDVLLLRGINENQYDQAKHQVVSMASCTTNALAPVVKVLRETCGIKHGLFSTIHAYTNTQALTDQPMGDRRDSWAAAENIIPSSSGAAKALVWIWPELDGKLTGKAYRVPVKTGSIAEINIVAEKPTSKEKLNDAFQKAAESGPLKGVMGVLSDEWASARILGDKHSSIVDLPLTQVQDGTLVSVAAWYDNEMGYATRLAEVANLLAG